MSDPVTAALPASGDVPVTPAASAKRAILRCAAPDVPSVERATGIALPTTSCGAVDRKGLATLWLGPDEWLLLSGSGDEHWIDRLRLATQDIACAIVDVSYRQVAFIVEGARAEDILASGCPLDLAQSALPVGMCTRTLFHKAEVVLWRTEPAAFRIEVWRSFAGYVEALLTDAAREG